jgi:hypothetical protein
MPTYIASILVQEGTRASLVEAEISPLMQEEISPIVWCVRAQTEDSDALVEVSTGLY